jgi:hypothetical protein
VIIYKDKQQAAILDNFAGMEKSFSGIKPAIFISVAFYQSSGFVFGDGRWIKQLALQIAFFYGIAINNMDCRETFGCCRHRFNECRQKVGRNPTRPYNVDVVWDLVIRVVHNDVLGLSKNRFAPEFAHESM